LGTNGGFPAQVRPELAALDVTRMRGLEIGPLASPRVRKTDGSVLYVDHASTAELKRKYSSDQGMRGRLDEIVDVDYVIGDGQTIAELVAPEAPFDYVIASHVIEHIPDPLGWMADLAHVLRPGGILSLVIPDKRYCFDINRSLTEISDLVDANLRHLRQPTYRQTYDFYSKALIDLVDTAAVWAGTADYSLVVPQDCDDPDAAALDACLRMQQSDAFVDVHCQVFTPDSFLALFEKLMHLGLVDFEIAEFFPTQVNTLEFHVSLRLLASSGDRKAMLQSQRAALARVRARLRASVSLSAASERRLVTMPVSQLEERLLLYKRHAIGRVRATLKRSRNGAVPR
jgi:SAM-dependent methyltransferase